MCALSQPMYKRIVLKISVEVFYGINTVDFKHFIINKIVQEIQQLINFGIEISIIIGGGNLFRGKNYFSLVLRKLYLIMLVCYQQ